MEDQLNGSASTSRPVLLIGATGFIGSALARCLASRGVRLRCTVRSGSRTERLDGVDFEAVPADLCSPETLGPALDGCRAVVHLASPSAWREIESPRLEAARCSRPAAEEAKRRITRHAPSRTVGSASRVSSAHLPILKIRDIVGQRGQIAGSSVIR